MRSLPLLNGPKQIPHDSPSVGRKVFAVLAEENVLYAPDKGSFIVKLGAEHCSVL
jgi:hypothetical protein